MSMAYLEHLDRLSDADYAAECGGPHDCSVAEMEYRGHSENVERPMTVVRQRARQYDPNDLPVCLTTLKWSLNSGYY